MSATPRACNVQIKHPSGGQQGGGFCLFGCWLPHDMKQIKPNGLSEQGFFSILSNACAKKEECYFWSVTDTA